jgi:hypothetical protein
MASSKSSAMGTANTLVLVGTLTDEGVECQAMREDKSNELFTLSPPHKLDGFKNGDHVTVKGAVATVSFCHQGTTVNIASIKKT